MHTKLKPILLLSFIFFCHTAFADQIGIGSKKLVKSFKLGAVGYTLYESYKPSKLDNDTSFYLLYRVGKVKMVAKEIKTIFSKSKRDTLASATYEINKNAIVFYQDTWDAFYHRTYTQNKNGLLSFKSDLVPEVKAPSAPVIASPAPNYDNTGQPNAVDIMPEFPGGMTALRNYIANNLQYPDEASEEGIEGTVYAKFVITKDGSIANIEIERKLGYGCDQEVIRILKKMPKWSPGKLDGKAVNYQYRMPVSFKLQ
ncbi:MAG: energy transducer TonB [Pedobacter sp.]|nr:MAG: energy transducer TonB [Pedobacter sp.]